MMNVAILDGWGNVDGGIVRSASVRSASEAFKWIRANSLDPWNTAPLSTCTYVERGINVDYGSHRYFGFLFKNPKHTRRQEKMKQTNKTAKAAAKPLAKTISKPQTVDVSGLKVLSVTLTEKGRLVIKYAK